MKVGDLISWVGSGGLGDTVDKVLEDHEDSPVGLIVGFDDEGDPLILFPASNNWLQSGPQYSRNVEVISESR